MDFETYTRSKRPDYAALADTVASILQAAISAYPRPLRLQQVQQRTKDPDRLRKKLEDRGILATTALAESYIRLLDRRIAAEQRRSEESIEMRKRMYDDPGAGSET